MAQHDALLSAAGAAIRRIERLEYGLVVAVSEHAGCKTDTKCGDRRWDNPECECAAIARKYVPASER